MTEPGVPFEQPITNDLFIDKHGLDGSREILARFLDRLIFVRLDDGRRYGGVLRQITPNHIKIDEEDIRIDKIWMLFATSEVKS